MQSGSLSKRYARALFELARESGQIDTVLKELERFEETLRQSEPLRQVLTTPSFSGQQREAVLRELLGTMNFSATSNHFLLLIAQKRRMDSFENILREYRNYFDREQGLVRVTVTSAVPLPVDLEKQLVSRIETMVNRKVILTRNVDPKILGGVVTRVGDLLFDGSLSTQLARMKAALLQEQLS